MFEILRRLRTDQTGGAALEFAIVGPILLLMLFGCIEFGRYFWIRNSLEFAVEESARYAVLNNDATQSDIQTSVRSRVQGIPPTSIDVVVTSTDGSNVTFKTITATYNSNIADGNASDRLRFMGGFLPIKMLKLEAKTRVAVPKD